MDIEYLPHGFGYHFKEKENYRFHCHHGEEECEAHEIIACAIKYYG